LSKKKPIWETEEWKITREKVKKSFCEWCLAENSVLVVNQTWSFPNFTRIKRNALQEIIEREIQNKKLKPFLLPEIMQDRYTLTLCPSCDSSSLRIRKTKQPKYICNACSNEFVEPVFATDWNAREVRELHRNWLMNIEAQHELELNDKIEETTTNLQKKYLSGEFTITLCRKCSYQKKLGKSLCQTCKIGYHSKKYETCFNCNSIICTKCIINRVSKMRDDTLCDDCLTTDKISLICKICKITEVVPDENFGVTICADCVLKGHWIDN